MLGVQSCKHFGCQRSHPMILGFGHPSGAMEDGARGKILVFKQWKWTDYYINYVESVYSRVNCSSWANKKVVLWCKGWILSAVQNAWQDEFFQGPKIFLRLTLCWKNLKWKVVPKKANIWPCARFLTPILTLEYNSPRKITSIMVLRRVFFGFLHKKRLAGRIFSEGRNFFTIDPMLEKSQVKSGPQKGPNLTVCRASHPNFDTWIQFSRRRNQMTTWENTMQPLYTRKRFLNFVRTKYVLTKALYVHNWIQVPSLWS